MTTLELALTATAAIGWLLFAVAVGGLRHAYRTGVVDGAERTAEAMLDLEDDTDDIVDGLRASWRREREATGRPN